MRIAICDDEEKYRIQLRTILDKLLINTDDDIETFSDGNILADKFQKEPFDLDNPLLSMENVVVAPHIGGATQEASTRSSVACAIAIDDFFAGRTPKFVVPELRELIS